MLIAAVLQEILNVCIATMYVPLATEKSNPTGWYLFWTETELFFIDPSFTFIGTNSFDLFLKFLIYDYISFLCIILLKQLRTFFFKI